MRILGHPVHPMLIVFPLGLFTTAIIFDILFMITKNPILPTISFYMIAAGILGGLLAAIFGLADWLGLPKGSRARHLGAWHGLGNLTLVIFFALSWILRMADANRFPSALALILSFGGALISLVTGWLGGELVYRLGSAVDDGANPDAPSSLSDQPASAKTGKIRQTSR